MSVQTLPERHDRFPDETALVRRMLVDGREPDAMRHVMAAYRSALAAYFAGSSFRWKFPDLESAESAVDEFFAERVGRDGFLRSWLGGSSRFRYWLLVAFVNHLRHRLRRDRSEVRRRERFGERQQRVPRDTVRDRFEAELARGMLREAMSMAQEACTADGRADDWSTFLAHAVDDRSYADLMEREQLTRRQVANRIRFAQTRLRESLQQLMALGGEGDQDIHRMKEAIERCRS